jgi:hypothetical protein
VFSIDTILVNVMCALIGYFFGNRLALGRDKRREFNNLISPIRRDLFGVRENPMCNIGGAWHVTMFLIREKLPPWKRRAFDKAIENFKESKGENNQKLDEMGSPFFKDTTVIVHAANDLLKLLKPR